MRTAVLVISVVLLCILVSFLKELGLLFLLNYGIFFHKFLSKLIFFRFLTLTVSWLALEDVFQFKTNGSFGIVGSKKCSRCQIFFVFLRFAGLY